MLEDDTVQVPPKYRGGAWWGSGHSWLGLGLVRFRVGLG